MCEEEYFVIIENIIQIWHFEQMTDQWQIILLLFKSNYSELPSNTGIMVKNILRGEKQKDRKYDKQ